MSQTRGGRLALTVRSVDDDMDVWAQTMTNLGGALRRWSVLQDGQTELTGLAEARRLLHEVRAVVDEETWPRYWPVLNATLADVCAVMGVRLGGDEGLRLLTEAETATRAVLTDGVRARAPTLYGKAEAALGTLTGLISAHKPPRVTTTFRYTPTPKHDTDT